MENQIWANPEQNPKLHAATGKNAKRKKAAARAAAANRDESDESSSDNSEAPEAPDSPRRATGKPEDDPVSSSEENDQHDEGAGASAAATTSRGKGGRGKSRAAPKPAATRTGPAAAPPAQPAAAAPTPGRRQARPARNPQLAVIRFLREECSRHRAEASSSTPTGPSATTGSTGAAAAAVTTTASTTATSCGGDDYGCAREALEKLREKHGVRAAAHNSHPQLFALKYVQHECAPERLADLNGVPAGCRGLVLSHSRNSGGCEWAVVARPFDKFLNYGEPLAPEMDWGKCKIYEKIDGTLCILYFYNGEWIMSTGGSADGMGQVKSASTLTFCDLFWRIFKKSGYSTPSSPEAINYTFMFELVSPLNRVLIPYDTEALYLLGARSIQTGSELDPAQASRLAGVPYTLCPLREGLCTYEQVIHALRMCDPLKHEGFVAVDYTRGIRVKVKHPAYVCMHHALGDKHWGADRLIEIVRSAEVGEVLAYFPELKGRIEEMADIYSKIEQKMTTEWEACKSIDRKKFQIFLCNTPFPDTMEALRSGKCTSVRDFLASVEIKKLREMFGISSGKEKDKRKRNKRGKAQENETNLENGTSEANEPLDRLEEIHPQYRIVHGSEDSVDLDVVYIVANMPSVAQCHAFCNAGASSSPVENRNIATVSNGVISKCLKGLPDELNNAIRRTFKLHVENNSLVCPILRNTGRDINGKARVSLQSILGLLIHNTDAETRAVIESAVKSALHSQDIQSMANALKTITLQAVIPVLGVEERKRIAFQVGQLLALIQNVELYTKKEISDYFPETRPLLYRKPVLSPEESDLFIQSLLRLCNSISSRNTTVPLQIPPECFALPKPIESLCIFDFDATLFASPSPNPSLWTESSLRILNSTWEEGGLNWFGSAESLNPPYVPQLAPESFWTASLVTRFKAISGLTGKVLLTGRTQMHSARLLDLLSQQGLQFDLVIVRELQRAPGHQSGLSDCLRTVIGSWCMPSLRFKQEAIKHLLQANPHVHTIELWDDNEAQMTEIAKHATLFSSPGTTTSSHLVVPHRTILSQTAERDLVSRLIASSPNKFSLHETTSYVAAVLNPASKERLLSAITIPEGWTIHATHMTIHLGPVRNKPSRESKPKANPKGANKKSGKTSKANKRGPDSTNSDEEDNNNSTESVHYKLGEQMEIIATAVGRTAKALAVKVEGVPTSRRLCDTGGVPHVTIATNTAGGKPKDSKEIHAWEPLAAPITLTGLVTAVQQLSLTAT
ncbi:2'-5' RNA ligase [Pelomyxa schiedti]|nr:2'-5' RNA ligase [Pelomyxa schiedti]